MMKCNEVKDLLPQYLDHTCSEETNKEIEKHLQQCENCKKLKTELEDDNKRQSTDQDFDRKVEPIKKSKKKITRKKIIIAIVAIIMIAMIGFISVLLYGQINKKCISFEYIYDSVRFNQIGKEFAKGNIDPLYAEIWNSYFNRNEDAVILQNKYKSQDAYDKAMKSAIQSKYNHYFGGKHLSYEGISDIGYEPDHFNGQTLAIYLKFTGDNNIEYYLCLHKEKDGKYRIHDYFGEGEITYVSTKEGTDETKDDSEVKGAYRTNNSLFACLSNNDDDEIYSQRSVMRVFGKRAVEGTDKELFDTSSSLCMFVDEKELNNPIAEGQYSKQLGERLTSIVKMNYYPTDIVKNVIDYDVDKQLFIDQVTVEFTGSQKKDKAYVTLSVYRYRNEYVPIGGTSKVYGDEISGELKGKLEGLF